MPSKTSFECKKNHGKWPYRTVSTRRLTPLGILWLFVWLLASGAAYGQESGSIRGRIIADGGKPLADYGVHISSGSAQSTSRSTTTDADGNFQFNNLSDRSYNISLSIQKGYILAGPTRLGNLRPGETVTITMRKGGVITGRVTDPNGDPVAGISVSAIRIRNEEDKKINASSSGFPRTTDDRGIYRLYGLQPGTYLIVANGGQSFVAPVLSPFHGETPTYHPSSTRDTAAEVKVSSGGEASGVDIRYRGESGRTVSGKLSGAELALMNTSASVSLRDAATGVTAANTFVQKSLGESTFALQGVPDGEYELEARYGNSESDEMFASEPRRITVKGADISGLDLPMISLAIVYGRVSLEKSASVCDPKRKISFEEMSFFATYDERANAKPLSRRQVPYGSGSPNEQGDFKITRLTPGRYRLTAGLQNETWFVKSISGPVLSLSSRGVPVRSGVTAELSRSGLALKAAERYSDVTVAVSDGGATLQGKVAAKEGASLPSRLQVHLIPAELAAANELLRYAESRASKTGEFGFRNIAPGKYFLLTRALPDSDEIERQSNPLAWDAASRARLRKDAEAAKNEIELKPCQRVKDLALPNQM